MADLTEAEADAQWEEDIEVVEGLMDRLRSDLTKAGFWANEHEEGRIQIRAYARSGYPIELDTR